MKFNEGDLVIIGFGVGTIILSLLRLANIFQSAIAIAGFSIAGGLFVIGDFIKYCSEYLRETNKPKGAKILYFFFAFCYVSSPVISLVGFFFSMLALTSKNPKVMSESWARIGDFSTLFSMGLIFTLLIAKNKIVKRLESAINLENSKIHAEGDINIYVKQ
ncbi:hypothetical protein ABE288_14350 [Bacillus salipaludis]|uniref:hypothetical protein n=1 Tax=Bacillus salipaludis TaxID=2547811 RepID=UPI003D1E55D6